MTQHLQKNLVNNISDTLRFLAKPFSIAIMSLFVIITTLGTLQASASTPTVNVVSSIKPIQLITTAIVGDLGESTILLPPTANPHNYQLRPSQRALLNNADLFIWVGPELELFLVKVLSTASVKQISLIQALDLRPERPTIHHNQRHSNENHHHDDHNQSETNDNGSFDPHIWLNPALAEEIANVIYQHLSVQYPTLEPQFNINLRQFITQLHIAENEVAALFESKNQIAIYTFHEAFTHFADHYGLAITGTITQTPEARPGAKHLSMLTQEIRQNQKICLVKEPNFKAPYVESITRGTEVIITTADPLATNIDNSATGYFEFIKSIANSFYKCSQ